MAVEAVEDGRLGGHHQLQHSSYACAEAGDIAGAEQWLSLMLKAGVEAVLCQT